MSRSFVESLESRTLFAGVTLLATGRLGGTNGWIQTMTNAITARLGGSSQVAQYVLSINIDSKTGNLVAGIQHVAGTPTPQTSGSGETIVQIDYYNISANASYSSTAIGQTIANYLTSTPVDGVLLASLPIHTVGASRGTALMDQVANRLGQSGIWVGQETYLDPDPIAAQGDPGSAVYDNVEFADNYWRNDGSASQTNDGNPVSGAYNLNTYWLDANSAGYVTPHLAPTGYYIGTIDPTATQSGEGPIYSNWYGNTPTMPARNATGFIYTDLVGAVRPSSGVWGNAGGAGTRVATTQQGTQWGSIGDLARSGGSTITAGTGITASFLYEDRDSSDVVTLFLDNDRNPFNGYQPSPNQSSVNVSQSGPISQGSGSLSTVGLAPGTYWVGAKITDPSGNTRYAYTPVNAALTVVGIGGSVVGAKAVAPSSYNLTASGTSDWAHWGRAGSYSNFDHKATGGSQISNVTVVGSGANFGGYSDSSRSATWTDGSPVGSDTNDNGYIWSNGSLNTGYSFTVPADTTTRTLTVYAGGNNTSTSLTAHLSDGSAADFVATAGQAGIYTNAYTITYKAGSAGQKLTITLLKTGNIVGTNGSVDLVAATLASSGTMVDTTPPTATLQSTSTINSPAAAETLKVVYTDNVSVQAASLATGNLSLNGPIARTATFVGASSGNNPTITATYSVAAPAGGWTSSANGTYTVSLVGNSVGDPSGNFAAGATLGTFQVAIPSAGGGSLAATQFVAPSTYNLTSQGTSDWAHWGRGSNYANFDHKATGGSQISNVSVVGSGANFGGYSDSSRNATWSDGSPLGSDTNENGYIWSNGALNTGYSFTVPADTTSRTVTVYAGGNNVSTSLRAHLSDGSFQDFVGTAGQAGIYTNVYSITYKAASAGQTLTITVLKTGNIVGTSGSVDLVGATLAGGSVSQPGNGSLVGSQAVAGSAYNLTSLGARDWAHWGRGNVYGNFDHKATGGSQISNVSVLGSGSYGSYLDPSRSVNWSDGSPTSSVTGDDGYIWANNALNAGYSFTVPADTTTRTLYVYAGGYSSGATLTAHLSDGSAADYTVTASGGGLYTNFYTITFKAASANQKLTISYVKSANINGNSGSVDLIGAALA